MLSKSSEPIGKGEDLRNVINERRKRRCSRHDDRRSRSPDVKRKQNRSRSRSRSRDRGRSSNCKLTPDATQELLPISLKDFLEKWKIDARKEHKLVNHLMRMDVVARTKTMRRFRPTNPNIPAAIVLKAYVRFQERSPTQR